MTRVAGANPRIWVDIFLENARRARRGARRAPPPHRAGRGRARGRRRRLPRALDRRGGREPAADARDARTPTRARCSGCASTSPTGRACSPGSRRRSAPSGSTSRTSSSQHISPERGGTLTLLVAGEDEAARAARAARGAGLRRRRLAGARGARSDEIEPARGARRRHIARPGRQVDLAPRACCSARSPTARRAIARLRPLRRHRERRSRAVRALGVDGRRGSDADTLRVRGVGLRGLRAPDGRSTAATPARSMRLLSGHARRPGGPRSSSPATSRSRARPMERIAEPLRRMGARDRDDRRPRAARRSRAAASTADQLRAARSRARR